MLWLEGNVEGVGNVILGHCCDGDIFGVREVGFGGAVDVAEELGDLADTVRAVVEKE